MVKILSIDPNPIHEIPMRCASPGKRSKTIDRVLPVYIATVDELPANLAALIVTSDLQGEDPAMSRLIGHRVAEELETLADERHLIPTSLQTGVILAGDLYATLHQMGGLGDVRSIWEDFRRRFRWVAGVAGNHDSFGSTPANFEEFINTANLYYLDGKIRQVDQLSIAGISGLISKKTLPLRRPEKVYRELMRDLLKKSPDILILHEGPSDPDRKLSGNDAIRSELIDCQSLLTICGHVYWKEPLTDLPQGGQILNVDGRVVILVPAG
jgi:3',5'-cyclic-AMP phosphodiesterase